jgi:predicted dehydrogenase
MKSGRRTFSRRSFLKYSTAAVALGWTARSYSQVVGANDALRVAVVGCNDCGRSHINQIRRLGGVRLVALCDVDEAVLDRDLAMIGDSGNQIARYRDVRNLLENRDIDAITVATPNHWHALITLWACQAGKDVYCEKPTCHEIWEGAQALAASRKYNRIVQAGTQWRSDPRVFEAIQWAKAGNHGKIRVSRGFCYKRRASIGKTEGPQPIPATVDYDLWCGPAPNSPLRRKNLHYDWHWFWPTGNGDIGNQGAHNMDLARWALDKPTVAPSVISVGGRFGYVDDGHTPNTLMTVHDYGDALLIFEVRGLPAKSGAKSQMDQYKGVDIGNVIECEGGYVSIDAKQCAAFDRDDKQIRQFTGTDVTRDRSHIDNFLKAVRSRRREDQQGELAEGHVSSSLSHLSNISYRLGQQTDPEAIKSSLKGNAAAMETFGRLQAHLAANDIHLDIDKATLGVPLRVDPQGPRFIGNPEADAMLTRKYRAPFVVPGIET